MNLYQAMPSSARIGWRDFDFVYRMQVRYSTVMEAAEVAALL